MISFESVRLEFRELDTEELGRWIAAALVHAEGTPGAWQFQEIDVARIGLILALRRELEIEERTLPVVLSLVDQLYDMRRRITKLNAAFSEVPEDIKAALVDRLG
jgi:chaperone modulatory protein CbpM